MSKRSTPLGFLPGEVDVGAHCMFAYPKRDSVFYDRLAAYLKAGLDSGEMCVCVTPATPRAMVDHLKNSGLDADYAVRTGQLAVHSADGVYLKSGSFDTEGVAGFWSKAVETARSHWNGIRAFGDIQDATASRTLRLKLLEYESRANLSSSLTKMSLCAYSTNSTPRALLAQMKSVHPFIATVRSIQSNRRYIEPARFLSSLYRLQRISRAYPATARSARDCRRHLEEIAARTPMTMREIDDMKLAVGEAFANALEHGCSGQPADRCHIHVRFVPREDSLTVEVRDHGPGLPTPPAEDCGEPASLRGRGFHLMRSLATAVDVDRRKDDTVVTLRLDYALPFSL